MDSDEFKRIIKALKPFTRIDSEKMKYIKIDIDSKNQEIRFEALDGHRIGIEYLKCEADENFTVYITPFTPWKSMDRFAEIELKDQKVYITMGNQIIGFKQPDIEWFDTASMLKELQEQEIKSKIGVDPSLLAESIKYFSVISRSPVVKMEIREPNQAIIIKNAMEPRNMRLVLPTRISNWED